MTTLFAALLPPLSNLAHNVPIPRLSVKRFKRPVILGGSTRISQPLSERLLLRQVVRSQVDDD